MKNLKHIEKMYYPCGMRNVFPLKEFIKNIVDKGYKVEVIKKGVLGDADVNIYEEVEMKEE